MTPLNVFLICLKCNTVSTQTSLYRCFFSCVSRNVNHCRIFSKDLGYKYIFFETLLLSLCLERVFAFFLEYCTENLIQIIEILHFLVA